ncbi:unnamed protein product [Gulo gulo]|uniref:Uncharacterized protein n=1 Tax=Gulo gulo TaxID=48420 RepID=A0A9X9LPD4_GULGU|nr:unnamed protein product [Gulo gulo]
MAPGHDQPVHAGCRLHCQPDEQLQQVLETALATRDCPESFFPRNHHPQQLPSPPDDVHPQQNTCHTTQFS